MSFTNFVNKFVRIKEKDNFSQNFPTLSVFQVFYLPIAFQIISTKNMTVSRKYNKKYILDLLAF